MSIIFNDPALKEIRQCLRNHSTKAEKLLWECLRRKRLKGYKFRRQYGVDDYIIDFYCPEMRLAIEVDGEYHNNTETREYDQQRQDYLEACGIRFLRFTNENIYKNVGKVLEEILQFIINNPF